MRLFIPMIAIVACLLALGCAVNLAEAQEAYADCFLDNYRVAIAEVPPEYAVALRAEWDCPYPAPPKFPTREVYLECREHTGQLVRSKYGDLESKAIQVIENDFMQHLTGSMCLRNYRADLDSYYDGLKRGEQE